MDQLSLFQAANTHIEAKNRQKVMLLPSAHKLQATKVMFDAFAVARVKKSCPLFWPHTKQSSRRANLAVRIEREGALGWEKEGIEQL